MARVYGLDTIRMASEDVLPFNYEDYGKEIGAYVKAADQKAKDTFGAKAPSFADAQKAASRLEKAGAQMLQTQSGMKGNPARVNQALRDTERAFLIDGLPDRPWYKHSIYAPGKYTGYAAVVIPGVNEAIDAGDAALTQAQLKVLTDAINRAAETLEKGM
jgi:N-acetylated-alpha-linked acidic dipeptidase